MTKQEFIDLFTEEQKKEIANCTISDFFDRHKYLNKKTTPPEAEMYAEELMKICKSYLH